MVNIQDFKKRYVSTVTFNEGDKILVTKENIKYLRQVLKDTNFHWVSNEQITKSISFQPDRVIILSNTETTYATLDQIDKYNDHSDAINYVFINY